MSSTPRKTWFALLMAALALVGTGSTANPARAKDSSGVPQIRLNEYGAPAAGIPIGETFDLVGTPGKHTVAIQPVFIRYSYGPWSINPTPSESTRNKKHSRRPRDCEEIRRVLTKTKDDLRAPNDKHPLGHIIGRAAASDIWERPGEKQKKDPATREQRVYDFLDQHAAVLVGPAWVEVPDADAESKAKDFSIRISNPSFFRFGAKYCAFLYEDVVQTRDATRELHVEYLGWAKLEADRCAAHPSGLGCQVDEKAKGRLATKLKRVIKKHSLKPAAQTILEAYDDAAQHPIDIYWTLGAAKNAHSARETSRIRNFERDLPAPVRTDALVSALSYKGQVTESAAPCCVCTLRPRECGTDGSSHSKDRPSCQGPKVDEEKWVRDCRETTQYYFNGKKVSKIDLTRDLATILVEFADPAKTSTRISTSQIDLGGATFRDLLELARGRVRLGAGTTYEHLSTAYERRLAPELDVRDLDYRALRTHSTPAIDQTILDLRPLERVIAVHSSKIIDDGITKLLAHRIDGKRPTFAEFSDFLKYLIQFQSAIEQWQVHGSKLNVTVTDRIPRTPRLVRFPQTLQLTADARVDEFVVPSAGMATIFPPGAEAFVIPYAGLQIYLWPNEANEPMWINGAEDWRRFFSFEVGLGMVAEQFGPDQRYEHLTQYKTPPVLLGLGLQPFPYVTASAGVAMMKVRRTPLADERPAFLPTFYIGASIELNVFNALRKQFGKPVEVFANADSETKP